MARWSDDELLVLLAFYFRFPRSSHTDSHRDCQKLARVIGRTPGAVDNQLRNIDVDLIRAAGDRHVSTRLAELLDEHKNNLQQLYGQANRVIRRRRWRFNNF